MEYDDSTSSSGCSTCSSGGGSSQVARIVYPTFTKEFTYDKRGRKTEEVDVLSDTETCSTSYEYDDGGNLVSKTDKEGNVTTFEYDKNNRLVKETRPMAEAASYAYDALGNLVTKTDAKGQVTEYSYDDTGKLVDVKYYNPDDPVNPVKEVDFSYDKVGNLKTYDDGRTTGAYVYDSAYRKVSETIDYGDFEKTFSYGFLISMGQIPRSLLRKFEFVFRYPVACCGVVH